MLTIAQLCVAFIIGACFGMCVREAVVGGQDRIDGGHTKGRTRQSVPPRAGRR